MSDGLWNIFSSEFPNITEKSWRRKRWRKLANPKRDVFQVNAKKVNTNFLQIYTESINYFACSFKDFGCAQRFDNLILSFNMVVPFFTVEFAETRFSIDNYLPAVFIIKNENS